MKTTNISDLKKHLSARLHAVQAGEAFVVTDRNVPVAMLEPLSSGTRDVGKDGLIADGVMAPRLRELNMKKFRALPRATWSGGLSKAIAEERDGR